MGRRSFDLRKHLARKGLFNQLPIAFDYKEVEPEIKLGRAILDRVLLDVQTTASCDLFFDVENPDFIDLCFLGVLEPSVTQQRARVVFRKLISK